MKLSDDEVNVLLIMFDQLRNKRHLYPTEINIVAKLQKLQSELYMTQEVTLQGIVTEWYSQDNNSRSFMLKSNPKESNGLFIEIGSWDTTHSHSEFDQLIRLGNKIEIEISSRALKAGELGRLPDGDVT
jgi:hypothetical protein